jgi:glycerol-3-phosphate dehydrogenase (NAD(P)+)
MAELSVAVLGGERWAKALTALLKHNQNKLRGDIRQVIEYVPSPVDSADPEKTPLAPLLPESNDKTATSVPADSADAGMMARTAAPLAKVAAGVGAKLPKASLESDSEDATIVHLTADRLLGSIALSASEANTQKDLGSADLIFLAVPAQTVRTVLRQVRSVLRPRQMLVHCVNGFFPAEPKNDEPAYLISSIIRQETPLTRIGALAGPALPEDLEEWSPAALVCGSTTEQVISSTRQVLGCTTLRIYGSSDLPGVEVAAAMAGIVALASGICDAQQLGLSIRAMLVSRAVTEISHLGTHLGGAERTFLGLAGFGAFMLASEARDGADFQLGKLLGSGAEPAKAVAALERPCNSLITIRDAYHLAEQHGLRTPILTALYRILFQGAARSTAITDLLEDPHYSE